MSDTRPAFVSVLMPVRNEASRITQSLGAVLSQDYPSEYIEIILADGLSEDETVAAVLSLPGADRVRIVQNRDRIQSAGLNQMLRIARGEIIVRVDGHTEIAPDYVRRCVETLDAVDADCVGGALNTVGQTTMGRAIAAAGKSSFFVPATFRVSSTAAYTDTVYMGAWRRSVFDQVDRFDESLAVNEDYEFNYRLRRAGGRIFFTPSICSRYYGQETLHALVRQYFRYGLWKSTMLAKHPASFRARHAVAPVFVAFVVAGYLVSMTNPNIAPFWELGVAAYVLLNGLFALRAGRSEPPSVLLRTPLVYPTVHVAWGLGFWFGVLRVIASLLRRNLP